MFHKIKWVFQRLFRGYSDSDLFDLDCHLAKLILKRLYAFKKANKPGLPYDKKKGDFLTSEEWDELFDSMIWSLEYIISGRWFDLSDNLKIDKDLERYKKGMHNFAEYFSSLWL